MNEIVLTPAALFDILQQIDELSGYAISVDETSSYLQIQVGSSVYKIAKSTAESVPVPADALETVKEVNESTYDELDASDTVESGLIKELAKTLLVGGLIRLTNKLLRGGKK